MNKTFKISAIVASLLVSGILVGCGSSSSSGSSSGGDTPKPPTPTPKERVITVTDDYVIGATVFSIAEKNARGNSTSNGTSTGNGTLPDPVLPTPDPVPTDPGVPSVDDQPIYIDDGKKQAEAKPYIDPKTNKAVAGKYKFDNLDPASVVASNEGIVDVNGNGVADTGEPKALSMASRASNSYVNPFTTLELFTTLNVQKVFGIEKADMDTVTKDLNTRKAVAYANAILAEAQFNSSRYDDSATPKPPSGSGTSDSYLPFSFKTTLEKVAAKVQASLNEGKSLSEAIAMLTGNDAYKTLGDNVESVDSFIISELNKYNGTNNKPNNKPNPGSDSGSYLPF